jgi:hypothetical protein
MHKPQSSFQFSLSTDLLSSRLPSACNFRGTCSVGPLGIAGNNAESQQLALVLLGAASRETARLAQHRYLVPKQRSGMPQRAPQSPVYGFGSPHQSRLLCLQDVEKYGALLPLIGDLVWARSLSLRFVSTMQDECRATNTSCHFTPRGPASPCSNCPTLQKFA